MLPPEIKNESELSLFSTTEPFSCTQDAFGKKAVVQWTERECAIWRELMLKGVDAQTISEAIGTKTPIQCMNRKHYLIRKLPADDEFRVFLASQKKFISRDVKKKHWSL